MSRIDDCGLPSVALLDFFDFSVNAFAMRVQMRHFVRCSRRVVTNKNNLNNKKNQFVFFIFHFYLFRNRQEVEEGREVEEGHHPIWTNMVVMMEEVQEVQEVEEGHPIWTMEEVQGRQQQQQKLQHDEVRTMHS